MKQRLVAVVFMNARGFRSPNGHIAVYLKLKERFCEWPHSTAGDLTRPGSFWMSDLKNFANLRSAQSTVQKATRDDLLMNHMGGNGVREPDAMVRAPRHDYLNLGHGNPSIQPRPVYNRLVSLSPVGILNSFFISNFVSVACLKNYPSVAKSMATLNIAFVCFTFAPSGAPCSRDVTDPRSQVRANLAAALLLGQVVFLTGIGSTSNSVSMSTLNKGE